MYDVTRILHTTQSQYTDTGLTSFRTIPLIPGAGGTAAKIPILYGLMFDPAGDRSATSRSRGERLNHSAPGAVRHVPLKRNH